MGINNGGFSKIFFFFFISIITQIAFASDINQNKVCVHYFEKKTALDLSEVNKLSIKELISEILIEARRLALVRAKDTEAHWSPTIYENSIIPKLLKIGKNFQQFVIYGKQIKTFKKISEDLGLEFSINKSSEYSLFGDDFETEDKIPDEQLVVASVFGDTEKTLRVFVAALKSRTLSNLELTSYPFLKDNFRYSLLRQNYSQIHFEPGILPRFSYPIYHYLNEIKDDPKGEKKHLVEICSGVSANEKLENIEADIRNYFIYDGHDFKIIDCAV